MKKKRLYVKARAATLEAQCQHLYNGCKQLGAITASIASKQVSVTLFWCCWGEPSLAINEPSPGVFLESCTANHPADMAQC